VNLSIDNLAFDSKINHRWKNSLINEQIKKFRFVNVFWNQSTSTLSFIHFLVSYRKENTEL